MQNPEAAVPETPEIPRLSDQEFFRIINDRNTGADGLPVDRTLSRRLTNKICLECQETYRDKFPGRPFEIVCKGIYDEKDFAEISELSGQDYNVVREIFDIPFWAFNHVKIPNAEGDLVAFIARDYQEQTMHCTAPRQVDRWGRGMGKTQVSIIKELHTATTRKRYNILVACPAKAQAQKWFDEISQTIQADAGLRDALVATRQQPYYTFRFSNESTINIFTTGSASGRDGDVVRSQSPRRVCVDEQDLLNPGDYKAIMPLLRRYKDSEFHGMSTPTGKRETFWAMCTDYTDYRELHLPITKHPDWSPEREISAKREARTEITYQHEFLAEFGEQEGGVFKSIYVDHAKSPFLYADMKPEPGWKYYMGVDWNGQGTGTRMRVVGYNPVTSKRKCVDLAALSGSTSDTLTELVRLNKRWHCSAVYIDAGFGYVQDELIRLIGYHATDLDTKRLLDVHVIDFGANMVTNKLVPKRGNNPYQQKDELERPTKPFMVEGAQMVLEMGDFEFSHDDKLLEEQLRAYCVKSYSRHGWANTYESRVGDHDLDAVFLALLGIEMKYGLTKIPEKGPKPPASIKHIPAFGSGAPTGILKDFRRNFAPERTTREVLQEKGNIPSRSAPQTAIMGGKPGAVVHTNGMGSLVSYTEYPNQAAEGSKGLSSNFAASGSRTVMFRGQMGGGKMGGGKTGLTHGAGRGRGRGVGLYR